MHDALRTLTGKPKGHITQAPQQLGPIPPDLLKGLTELIPFDPPLIPPTKLEARSTSNKRSRLGEIPGVVPTPGGVAPGLRPGSAAPPEVQPTSVPAASAALVSREVPTPPAGWAGAAEPAPAPLPGGGASAPPAASVPAPLGPGAPSELPRVDAPGSGAAPDAPPP